MKLRPCYLIKGNLLLGSVLLFSYLAFRINGFLR